MFPTTLKDDELGPAPGEVAHSRKLNQGSSQTVPIETLFQGIDIGDDIAAEDPDEPRNIQHEQHEAARAKRGAEGPAQGSVVKAPRYR